MSETLREPVRGWRVLLAEAEAERDELRAEVERLRADSLSSAPPYYRHWQEEKAQREQAEAALRDCWTVMDASKDPRERELARKMRAALRDTAPAEQPEAGEP